MSPVILSDDNQMTHPLENSLNIETNDSNNEKNSNSLNTNENNESKGQNNNEMILLKHWNHFW